MSGRVGQRPTDPGLLSQPRLSPASGPRANAQSLCDLCSVARDSAALGGLSCSLHKRTCVKLVEHVTYRNQFSPWWFGEASSVMSAVFPGDLGLCDKGFAGQVPVSILCASVPCHLLSVDL